MINFSCILHMRPKKTKTVPRGPKKSAKFRLISSLVTTQGKFFGKKCLLVQIEQFRIIL